MSYPSLKGFHPDFGRLSSPLALRRYRTKAVLKEVAAERDRQDERWGEQNHPDGTSTVFTGVASYIKRKNDRLAQQGAIAWQDILHEEFLEAVSETDEAALRAELVQVGAVAVAWIEAIDRRSA